MVGRVDLDYRYWWPSCYLIKTLASASILNSMASRPPGQHERCLQMGAVPTHGVWSLGRKTFDALFFQNLFQNTGELGGLAGESQVGRVRTIDGSLAIVAQ